MYTVIVLHLKFEQKKQISLIYLPDSPSHCEFRKLFFFPLF